MTLPTSMEPHRIGSIIHAGSPAMMPSDNSQNTYSLARTWLYVGASDPGRIAGAIGTDFGRSSDHGHYVSGSGGTGKSHLAQAIGHAAILQGYKVLYRETHVLLEELADATLDGTRKQYMENISSVALLIIDDFGMCKRPQTAAEDPLEIIIRRYERASTLLTSLRGRLGQAPGRCGCGERNRSTACYITALSSSAAQELAHASNHRG
jgi:IstB-like ATP binding protein